MMWELVQIVWNPGHVLEILILTVGIYYALRFVRGTRGAPVVTGFMVLLFTLVLLTFIFKLRVLQWLLGAISAYLAVAGVGVFCPERRLLLAGGGEQSRLAHPP